VLTATGSWTLHYDWELSGNYHRASIYFNFDGTFGYLAGANDGTWTQIEGMIIWRFKKLPNEESISIYTGNINGNFMSGIMFSAVGEKGRWYAVKKGTKVYALKEEENLPYLVEKESKPKLDPTGRKT
jgi:hypothetical protein